MGGNRQRTRSLFQNLFGRQPAPDQPAASPPEMVGENIAVVAGHVTFVDMAKAAAEPATWFAAFTAAVVRNVPVDREALRVIADHATEGTIASLMRVDGARQVIELLQPRPGLSRCLIEMRDCGLLPRLFPEIPHLGSPSERGAAGDRSADAPFAGIANLEQLLTGETLSAQRFGAMLRELNAPEILVLALLLRGANGSDRSAQAGQTAEAAARHFSLSTDAQQGIEFLVRHGPLMSLRASRQDTSDPEVIRSFASSFSTEEQLKMLCLMSVADPKIGGQALTPWKAEILWRLYVDTYNQLTMAYGDDVIDEAQAVLTSLNANRPPGMSEAALTTFLDGLPRRYLTLFDKDTIYKHVELCQDLGPDDVHYFVKRRAEVWELTVVTLDKPFLFSNISGVLSSLDLDIVRGQALTSLKSVVIDVFQFIDRQDRFSASQLDPRLADVVSGRVDVAALLGETPRKATPDADGHAAPTIYFDNEASHRYTILEIIARDSPRLLHRVSRAISSYGCNVELVLISTEGGKAVDVFHLSKGDVKLTYSDQLALTEHLEAALR